MSLHNNQLNLIPWPKNIEIGDGCINLPATLKISVNKETCTIGETLADDLKYCGYNVVLTDTKDANIQLKLVEDESLGDEGYQLTVNNEIEITANSSNGIFWGTRTVLQLLSEGPGSDMPELQIRDMPEYEFRGLEMDVARALHSIDFHKKMIKTLANLKMNYYHLHLSDCGDYMAPSENYHLLNKPNYHYTKQELIELVELANHYHITIIPEIDVPGHANRLCEVIPELACNGVEVDPKAGCGRRVCAGSEKTYEILDKLIGETAEIFPGKYFHIGADEVEDSSGWNNCPDCEAKITEESLGDNEGLFHYFINRVNKIVRKHGKTAIIWEGFIPGRYPEVDRDIIVDMFANKISPKDYLAAGYEILNASCYPIYVVRTWASPVDVIAKWNGQLFGRWFPPKSPEEEMVKVESKDQMKGVCICVWESSEESLAPMLLNVGQVPEGYVPAAEPRLPATAERAWTGSITTAEDLLSRLDHGKSKYQNHYLDCASTE